MGYPNSTVKSIGVVDRGKINNIEFHWNFTNFNEFFLKKIADVLIRKYKNNTNPISTH